MDKRLWTIFWWMWEVEYRKIQLNSMIQQENLSLFDIAQLVLSVYHQKPAEEALLLGITGSSGAGKTTLSLDLQKELQRLEPHNIVTVIQADNFIYANAYLEANHMMERKGFPESFDFQAFKKCLQTIKKNRCFPLVMPCYSQDIKDIIPEKKLNVEKSNIYLFEGVNLFFKYEAFHAIDYLDFCIFLDTERQLIKARALKRFFEAYAKSTIMPVPYFEKFSGWTEEAIREHAEGLWKRMDMELFENYIVPYKSLANLVLKSYNR